MMKDFLTLDKQLCFAVYETSAEFTKLYKDILRPFGLTYPQYLVLLALWRRDNVTMKELGNQVNLGTGTLTPMINRMQKNGWLHKERSIEDERKVYISLKEKARSEQKNITNRVLKEIERCNISLTEYEELMIRLNDLKQKLKNR